MEEKNKGLGFRELSDRLPELTQSRFRHSAITDTDVFKQILLEKKPKKVVEIGTFCGISTLVLASIADFVWTFDVEKREVVYDNWKIFDLTNKIRYTILPNRKSINKEINKINADFCFIDAIHDYPNVKADFNMCKKFKRILFHDAAFPGVNKFLKEINAEIINTDFAYWEK